MAIFALNGSIEVGEHRFRFEGTELVITEATDPAHVLARLCGDDVLDLITWLDLNRQTLYQAVIRQGVDQLKARVLAECDLTGGAIVTEEEQAEIAQRLADLTRYWREYHAQEHRSQWDRDEKTRWAAYHEARALAQRFHEAGMWFVERGIPLAFDETSKRYFVRTDPPIYSVQGGQPAQPAFGE